MNYKIIQIWLFTSVLTFFVGTLFASSIPLLELEKRSSHFLNVNSDSLFKYASLGYSNSQKKSNYHFLFSTYLANYYLHSGNLDSCQVYLWKLTNTSNFSSNNKLFGLFYNTHGVFNKRKGNYPEALTYYHKALSIQEKKNDKFSLAGSYSNIADIHMAQKDFKLAESFFQKALKIYLSFDNQKYISWTYNNLGILHGKKNEYSKAQPFLNKALKLQISLNELAGASRTYNNLGANYLKMDSIQKAMDSFLKSINLKKKINDHTGLCFAFFNLSAIHKNQSNYSVALDYLDSAQLKASQQGVKSILLRTHALRSEIFAIQDNYKQAYREHKIYLKYKDSIFNIQKTEQIEQLKQKYETDKKEQEIVLLKKDMQLTESEKQKSELEVRKAKSDQRLLIALILICACIFIFFIYNSRQKLKTASILAEKNNKIHLQDVDKILKKKEVEMLQAYMDGEENERSRIARDLHDRIGSLLSTIKLYFSSVENYILSAPENQVHQFFKASELLDVTTKEVRDISHNIESGTITTFGLLPAVENLCNIIADSNQLQIEFVPFNLEGRFDSKLEIEVYRIIQEILGNTMKHAHASEVTLQVNHFDDSLTVSIEDDGVGFDVNKIEEKSSGMGLKNIKSRVNSLHGKLIIDSMQGKGSSFIVEIPLN